MKKSTELAMSFLCKRNPFDDIAHSDYVFTLMDFQDKKGDGAIEALAGFYIYAINKIKGPKASKAIRTTFAHDLNGLNSKYCDPRSSSYGQFWIEEIKTWQGITI